MNKNLSIITICYNNEDVEKTCKSILEQSFQDFEWIVIDGGSKQDILDIFDKYKNRIDIFVSEKDNGIYDACNKGLKLASGKYISFLNAGDYYFYNDVLKDIFFNKTRTAGILYGNENFVFENSLKNYIKPMPQILTKEFLFYSTIRHQSSFIRRDLFEKYGLYDESYKVAGDYDKWFVFLKNNEVFEYLPYVIANFNMRGISQNKNSRAIAVDERNLIIDKYFSPDEIKYLRRKYERKMKYSFAENIFSLKNDYDRIYKIITILGIHIRINRRIKK